MHDSRYFNTQPAIINVHIGCRLGYIAAAPSPIIFLLRPHGDTCGKVVYERFTTSAGNKENRQTDVHGNRAIRTTLLPGYNDFVYEATLTLPARPDSDGICAGVTPIGELPLDVIHYTLPSRYCESDRLVDFAKDNFGDFPAGGLQVQAICDWVHANIEYRYGSGSSLLSACDVLRRRYGVCRDFAHVVIALCRALDLPARYVAGHIPRLLENSYGADSDIGRDFHAYVEVYLGGYWYTYDARHNRPLTGRIKIAHGMDAADAAFATFYGEVEATVFTAWSHQVNITSEAANHQPIIDATLRRASEAGHMIQRPVRINFTSPNYKVNDQEAAVT